MVLVMSCPLAGTAFHGAKPPHYTQHRSLLALTSSLAPSFEAREVTKGLASQPVKVWEPFVGSAKATPLGDDTINEGASVTVL